MLSPRSTTVIVGLVTTVWAVNFGAGLLIDSYTPDQAINGIFMAIVGGVLALGRGRNNGNGRNGKEPPR